MALRSFSLRRPLAWLRTRRVNNPGMDSFVEGLPYALVLALGLGLAVMVGANLSHASPSESRPFGWPGPSSFANGVAMNRGAYVLAATVPALLLGLVALGRRRPASFGIGSVVGVAGVHLMLVAGGCLLAGAIGAWASAKTPWEAYWAFVVAHALLAWTFYAIGLAGSACFGRFGPPAGAAVWVVYVGLYESWTRWRVFREVGYVGVQAGQLPAWFYVLQGLSPLSAYRAVLILWHPGFRNYEERAVLGSANLPAWMTPTLFGIVLLLWTAILIDGAMLGWWLRARAERQKSAASEGRIVAFPPPWMRETAGAAPAPRTEAGVPPRLSQ